MKSGADFEQTADASIQIDCAGRRFSDARKDLEQGAFAGAVAANDADGLARINLEADVAQRPDGLRGGAPIAAQTSERCAERVRQRVAQGPVSLTLANAVLLANIPSADN